jgi:hypothetical protein
MTEPIIYSDDNPLGLTDDDRANMAKYNIDDAWDEETKVFLGFACLGVGGFNGRCGMTYPSIEDRMLKEPDECSGCRARSRWG